MPELNSNAPTNPGDEAPAGTPGTGEDICPACSGSGKITEGIGGG